MRGVGPDAADLGGQVDDDVGREIGVQPGDVGLAGEVAVGAAGHAQPIVGHAALTQQITHVLPEKPGPAGDDDAVGGVVEHESEEGLTGCIRGGDGAAF